MIFKTIFLSIITNKRVNPGFNHPWLIWTTCNLLFFKHILSDEIKTKDSCHPHFEIQMWQFRLGVWLQDTIINNTTKETNLWINNQQMLCWKLKISKQRKINKNLFSVHNQLLCYFDIDFEIPLVEKTWNSSEMEGLFIHNDD